MPSFYFEQLLQSGLNGIDQQGITASILQIAGVILLLSLLCAVYEAYSHGGDVRLLGIAAIKYLLLGLILLNYSSAFRAVNSGFNTAADGIYKLSGGVDAIQSWGNSLSQAWQNDPNWFSSLWNLASGGISAAVAGAITLIGYLLLPFTYCLFTLFYALYGAILYVVGPLVLALMPSRGLGQLGRSFVANMMMFQCWGLLYAILQALMSALQITNPLQFNGSYLQAFVGASQVVIMSIASVLISVMIALIPLIASRIVKGDMGSTLITLISGALTAGAVAAGLGVAAGEGVAAGRALSSGGTAPAPAGPGGAFNPGSSSALLGQAPPAGDFASTMAASRAPSAAGSMTGAQPPAPVTTSNHQKTAADSLTTDAAKSQTAGSAGSFSRNYIRHGLTGVAAWQAGHMIGRAMRFMGMGTQQ